MICGLTVIDLKINQQTLNGGTLHSHPFFDLGGNKLPGLNHAGGGGMGEVRGEAGTGIKGLFAVDEMDVRLVECFDFCFHQFTERSRAALEVILDVVVTGEDSYKENGFVGMGDTKFMNEISNVGLGGFWIEFQHVDTTFDDRKIKIISGAEVVGHFWFAMTASAEAEVNQICI